MGQRRKDREWPKPRRTRHVWVKQEDWHYPPSAGIVLEWRRHSYHWYALVLWVVEGEGKAPAAVQCWLPVERLIPVRSDPNKGQVRYF